MAHEKFEQLKKLETYKELRELPADTEIIAIYRGLQPQASYTVHGKYVETYGIWLDIKDLVHFPFEIILDTDNPRYQLEFLRGLKGRKTSSYNHWSDLDQNHVVYRVK